jgi:hypothetical protein
MQAHLHRRPPALDGRGPVGMLSQADLAKKKLDIPVDDLVKLISTD